MHERLKDFAAGLVTLSAFAAFGLGLGCGVAAGFVVANEVAALIWRALQ